MPGFKIRIGVVGVGFLGERHVGACKRIPAVELAGVFDTDETRGRWISRRYKTRTFAKLDDLIDAVDALSIVTPTKDHHAIASLAISRGKHVLVEKPMTSDVGQADELLDAAKKAGVILQVGHVERFNAGIGALEKIIKTPKFIEVHRLGPYSFRSTDIDVVLDLMIHDIDIVLCLVGSPIKEISAYGTPVLSPTNDIANAKLVFENKCIANLTASRLTLDSMRKIRIFDEDKYVSLDYMRQEAYVYQKKIPAPVKPKSLIQLIHRKKLPIKKNEPLLAEIESFIDCVENSRQPKVPGEAGRDAIAIASEIICQIKKY